MNCNFQIEVEDGFYYITLDHEFIGQIEHNIEAGIWAVFPNEAEYSCVYNSFEEAVIELIFHTYRRHYKKICIC